MTEMDDYIEVLTNTAEHAIWVRTQMDAPDDLKYRWGDIEIAALHALAALEQAKAAGEQSEYLKRLADHFAPRNLTQAEAQAKLSKE